MKLFTPDGFEVTVKVDTAVDLKDLMGRVNFMSAKAFEAGFLVNSTQTALSMGEQKEEIGWCVRGTVEGREGPTPVLHLYSTRPGYVKPFIVCYINTKDDLLAFEAASGISLDTVPEYIGEGRIERGKNPRTDALVTKFRRPATLVWAPNPRYSEAESQSVKAAGKTYTVAKKKFSRWASASSPSTTATHAAPVQEHKPAPLKEVTRDEFNELLNGLRFAKNEAMLRAATDRGNKEVHRFSKYQREVFTHMKDRRKVELAQPVPQGAGQWKEGEAY